MGYLQLAENNDYLQDNSDYLQEDGDYLQEDGDYSQLADNSASQVMANYIFIPGGLLPNQPADKYVRLDFFDNLPENEYLAIMEKLLPYQKNTLSDSVVSNLLGMVPGVGGILKGGSNIIGGLLKGRKARKQAKNEAKASGTPPPPKKKGLFGGIFKDKGKNLPGAVSTAIAQTEQQQTTNTELPTKSTLLPIDINANVGGTDYSISTAPEKQSFFKKYKTPLLIGGGVLLLGGIYLITKKKRK